MTKELMVNAIYEKIADKTLSFGCKVKITNNLFSFKGKIVNYIGKTYFGTKTLVNLLYYENTWIKTPLEIDEIIGHPVMIGDVLDYILENDIRPNGGTGFLINIWHQTRKPIEEQSLDCIEYIYNLIK